MSILKNLNNDIDDLNEFCLKLEVILCAIINELLDLKRCDKE